MLFPAAKNKIKKKECSLQTSQETPQPPLSNKPKAQERVSVCASLTIECALVLPLFFLGMVSMICFMDLYRLQTEHLVSICQEAKKVGAYAYALDDTVEIVDLPDIYTYKIPVGIVPFPTIYMTNHGKVRAWTGYSPERDGTAEEQEEMVYVTDTGTVYHKRADCTYLQLSISQVPGSQIAGKRNEYGEKYHGCELCANHQEPGGMVYITDKGNKYHNSGTCSGLKRTIRLVKRSSVPWLSGCSRCAG